MGYVDILSELYYVKARFASLSLGTLRGILTLTLFSEAQRDVNWKN